MSDVGWKRQFVGDGGCEGGSRDRRNYHRGRSEKRRGAAWRKDASTTGRVPQVAGAERGRDVESFIQSHRSV